MSIIKNEISKELYDKVKNIEKWPERMQYFDIPIEWKCGYGYYGCDVMEQDGKFYVVHTIGSSCD